MWRRLRPTELAAVFLRFALAAGFLSAVADRFGLWGPADTPGVSWGGFASFLAYTGTLLWFLPAGLVPVAGWVSTVLEVVLALGLLAGFRLRAVALATGILLLVFAVTMTAALGFEPPLSYSVWSAAAAAFLLASLRPAGGDVGTRSSSYSSGSTETLSSATFTLL
ncbi:MAG TPA: DoxX family protein [Pirellulales bacterium]|nr:DoxX family protein [Pirellulales bacterium]